MRLVFISSVTAMMPLRTISVTTGSTLDFFVLFFAMNSLSALSRRPGMPTGSPSPLGGGDRGGPFLQASPHPPRCARRPPHKGEVVEQVAWPRFVSSSAHRNHQIAERIHLERIAR